MKSGKYKRKVIQSSKGHRLDITFLDHRWKRIQHPGQSVKARHPRTVRRCVPDKTSKLFIIKKWHKWRRRGRSGKRRSLKAFRWRYRKHCAGKTKWINKLSESAWRRYQHQFTPNSAKYKILKEYVDTNPERETKRKKRFKVDPRKVSYGIWPVFEKFLVNYRYNVATEYQWRSIDWLKNEGKRILKNKRLMQFLRKLMDEKERQSLNLALCTRGYIRKIVVCCLYFYSM